MPLTPERLNNIERGIYRQTPELLWSGTAVGAGHMMVCSEPISNFAFIWVVAQLMFTAGTMQVFKFKVPLWLGVYEPIGAFDWKPIAHTAWATTTADSVVGYAAGFSLEVYKGSDTLTLTRNKYTSMESGSTENTSTYNASGYYIKEIYGVGRITDKV